MTEDSSTLPECPVCLENQSFSECTFVLPCHKCEFSYCSKCVAEFVRSSRDDYQIASDGSRQVKVHVACPQCRSKYPMDISKVLLLRKVHELGLTAFAVDGKARDDSNLKATELSLKRDFGTPKKRRQVQLAHGLYLKVLEGKVDLVKMAEAEKIWERVFQNLPDLTGNSLDEEEEDEYVDNPTSPKRSRMQVDSSLFQGLHDFLGWDEKVFVTELFTSGEVPKLVQAAMILNGVLKLSMEPPSKRPQIRDQDRSRHNYKKAADLLERMKKSFPLANHMPGYFILPSFTSKQQYLSFQDKTWDGAIVPPSQSQRIFDHIYGDQYHPPNTENPRPIVTIHAVRGPAGRVGLRKGDIVTHVNEIEWTGTAKELLEHIHQLHDFHNEETVSITVNATPETGRFLQVRKEMMEKSQLELI